MCAIARGEMVAFVNGYNACLEATMHAFRCYAGFHNYGPLTRQAPGSEGGTSRSAVGPDHPDYLEWRKLYYTNGIAKA